MPLRLTPIEEMPEPYRTQAVSSIKKSGDALFLQAIMSAPHMVDFFFGGFYPDIFFQGVAPVRTKELARLRLAQLHLCGHCVRIDTAGLLERGLSQEEIDAVWDFENGPFSDADKAAMRLAGVLSNAEPEGHASEELIEELQRHFTDAQIVEMAMVCGIITGLAKMMFAFDIAQRDAQCPVQYARPAAS